MTKRRVIELLVVVLAGCSDPAVDPWPVLCSETDDGGGGGDVEILEEQGIALVHVESDTQQGLWWMDLSARDPLATATELFSGPWFPSRGRSDGRYTLVRLATGAQEGTYEGTLLDLRVLPPAPVDPGLPPGHVLLDGETTPDGSALILRAYDELEDTQRLWRLGLDELGEFGAPAVLTTMDLWPEGPDQARISFPGNHAYSADGTTLALIATIAPDWPGITAFTVDLAHEQGLQWARGADEWMSFRLTPDGGVMISTESAYADPYSTVRCTDLDSGMPLACNVPDGSGKRVFDWTENDGTFALGGVDDYIHGSAVGAVVVHIAGGQVESHPIDLNGIVVSNMYFHEDGEYLLLKDTEDNLWAACLTDRQPGPLVPVTGPVLGEAPVDLRLDETRRFAALTRGEGPNYECEIVQIDNATFTSHWPLGPCDSASAPVIRGNHLHTLVHTPESHHIWHLDLADDAALPEAIASTFTGYFDDFVPSSGGRWMFHHETDVGYFITGVAGPSVSQPLIFDGMTATQLVVVP